MMLKFIQNLRNSVLPTIFVHQTEQQSAMFATHIHQFEIAMKFVVILSKK